MYDIRNLNIWKQETRRQNPKDLDRDIEELELSVRSYNCLKRAGYHTVGDLLKLLQEDRSGLRQIRNLGSRSEAEILARVEQYQEESRMRGSAAEAVDPAVRRVIIRPARQFWDTDIGTFHLSEYAESRLRQSGIHKVRDLYIQEQGREPGWYAVRELFDKIPSAK